MMKRLLTTKLTMTSIPKCCLSLWIGSRKESMNIILEKFITKELSTLSQSTKSSAKTSLRRNNGLLKRRWICYYRRLVSLRKKLKISIRKWKRLLRMRAVSSRPKISIKW